jgi:lipopolysaccharide transport system permease protein
MPAAMPSPLDLASLPEWSIEPLSGSVIARLREVWQYRKLMAFFARKSLLKMYKRTKLGWVWLFIRPLFPLAVKTLVFGGMLGVATGGIPYFLFLLVGTSAWELFSQAVMWGTRSLELNRGFLAKIYIPRLILPVSMMTPAFFNFLIHLGVIAGAVIYYRVKTGTLYLTPLHLGFAMLAVVMAILLATGIAMWTSVPALSARDTRFSLSYFLGFWVYLTPVLYPLHSQRYGWLLSLNPMAAVVNAFKYGMLGIDPPTPRDLGVASALIITVLISGLLFFGRAEAQAGEKL